MDTASNAVIDADQGHALPRASVVVNTFNRAAQVGRAIDSVLSQSGVDVELVVVDDGSTDGTEAVLAGIADPRMRYVRQANRGLSGARNAGAREATSEWLLFLDDDDRLCDGGLRALLTASMDPTCRVVVGGVRFVDDAGRTVEERAPGSLDDALAGTFLIRRDLFHDAGGYLEGMPCSHQTELFIRVRHILMSQGGTAAYVATPVVEVERRAAAKRPQRSPANAYFGGRWLAVRHPDHYATRRSRATIETIAAVNAIRIGRAADGRRRLASALGLDPRSPMRYLRLVVALSAPLARRIWLRQWDTPPQPQRSLSRVRRSPACDGLERDPAPGSDSLFTPWQYRENPPGSPGATLPPRVTDQRRQDAPIYKLAARLARARSLAPIVDVDEFVGVEGDLDDEHVWDQIAGLKPQLVICSGVVEQVADPRRLLSGIHHAIAAGGSALIGTCDRSRGSSQPLGPPTDPSHIREWSAEEFSLLLESCDFEILRVHRLADRRSLGFLVRTS